MKPSTGSTLFHHSSTNEHHIRNKMLSINCYDRKTPTITYDRKKYYFQLKAAN